MPEPRSIGVLSPFVGGDYYGAVIAGVHRAARQAGEGVVALQTLDPGSHGADYSGVPDHRHPIARAHIAGVVGVVGVDDADDPEQILKQADAAMYLAKTDRAGE